ncbi:MAG: GMP reductase [Cyanobacteria bacterium]|nr:GMP reductase [Cyanobacteriota bacterium]
MHIESEIKLDFKDVLIRPKRSTLMSRKDVTLERTFRFRNSPIEWSGIPIVASNMDTVGTFSMAEKFANQGLLVCMHKFYSTLQWSEWLQKFDHKSLEQIKNTVAVSSGLSESDYDKLKAIYKQFPDFRFICLDVANGYTEKFMDFVKRVRDDFPNQVIIAGNVVTGEMTEALILAGADIIKVGIGSGSVCTTRNIAGVGYPQLSAIIECADAAHGLGGQIMGDGGCTVPGDIAKAFGAGADFVMLGGMLAGHDESDGKIVENELGEKHIYFYGMSSDTAMNQYYGGVATYRASEGKTVMIPYRGSVETTLQEILGGVRSSCTYVGADKLKDLPKRTTFIRVSQQINRIFTDFEVAKN